MSKELVTATVTISRLAVRASHHGVEFFIDHELAALKRSLLQKLAELEAEEANAPRV